MEMKRTKETLEARVRETPLLDRLKECRQRIGKMCSEGRPPRMCIPVQHDDDDFFICTTLADAQATVEALQKKYDDLLGKYRQLMDFYDKHNGTPCEQIRHQQQVEALQRERDEAVKRSSSYLVDKNAIQKELQRERGFTNRYLKRLHEAEAALNVERAAQKSLCDIIAELRTSLNAERERVRQNLLTIMDLQTQLTQLQALVRALPVAIAIHVDCSIERYVRYCTSEKLNYECAFPSKEYAQAFVKLLEYRATLDATTPARFTKEELTKWWHAQCPQCGWDGLSRDCAGGEPIADTGDYADPICPMCDQTGRCVVVDDYVEPKGGDGE